MTAMTDITIPDAAAVRAVLDTMVSCRQIADQQEANLLALAVELVAQHPVDDMDLGAEVGLGLPGIDEEAVAAMGAALGLSFGAAWSFVSDAVQLCHRLPRTWALVQSGRLQAWKARTVAASTGQLSPAAVAFVDQHLEHLAARNRVPAPAQLRALAHEALVQCDPEVAEGIEESALLARDVTFEHRESVETTRMTADLDTLDALDLEATIEDLAAEMRRLGDPNPIGARRAHALGSLAHPQRVLRLFGDPRQRTDPAPDSSADGPAGSWNATTATLYLHIDAADLATGADDSRPVVCGGGVAEQLSAATLARLRMWLQRADRVTIRPVLDLCRTDAVDEHDPPGWLRETVVLRDGRCVFPGCRVDARNCDLDHIDAYVPLDDGGPPGQTSADNLACLCRRHHRLKTFTSWTYAAARTDGGDRSFTWISPHGHRYLTHPDPKR